MFKSIINRIFKRDQDEEESNPFFEFQIIDRNIEPINICRQCNKSFGKKYGNIIIKKCDNDIHQITCKNCGHIHYFRNWK